ncbi:MAG: tRNA (N6-threonylcarbamoyladenosine(37)-N6)-methyltransferase TrmO [Hyphomicrobiaceae bacterium]|nr:tRNA (N6-threonylcarbamoyladenosine(37)-N6)-methyltransferase TrmO [Hyphomicrobiaceae bacterium]
MPEFKPIRPDEVVIDLPPATAAGLVFIGRIRSAYASPADCPKNTADRTEPAAIEVDPAFADGLIGIDGYSHLVVLVWLDRSRRDVIVQSPRHLDRPHGVFALRSPVRPNPIGLSVAEVLGREGCHIRIRATDFADGTPVLDIKPYLPRIDAVPAARTP